MTARIARSFDATLSISTNLSLREISDTKDLDMFIIDISLMLDILFGRLLWVALLCLRFALIVLVLFFHLAKSISIFSFSPIFFAH
jgi:hypothetical protein